MQAAIISCARETVDTFKDADTFNSCMMLAISVSWFARDVPLQSSCIPNLYRFVVGSRYKEHVIRRDCESGNGLRMGRQICNEVGFNPLR